VSQGGSSELDAALIEESGRKSDLIWITLPGLAQPRAAWHIWHEGAAYVVTGGIEQPLPGLPGADRVTVTVRSRDKRSRLVSWVARVTEVEPGTAEWDAVIPTLAKERLNAPDGEDQPRRWAREAYVLRLTPGGEVTESPGAMPDGSQAAPPVDTPAARGDHRPMMYGAKRRRVDR
jgi:hypothetical protein